MTRIGIMSDTHGTVEPKIFDFFADCDILLHAGDIGDVRVIEQLSGFKPFLAVYGNIDGQDIRVFYPEIQRFRCEDVNILMVHIGGYPGHYDRKIYPILQSEHPQLFISGHSHILKVMYDQKLQLLHINPGAIGNVGIHHVKTAIRLNIDGRNMKNLEVLELPRKKS